MTASSPVCVVCLRPTVSTGKELVTERHFKDTPSKNFRRNNRDIKLTTYYTDPEFDLPKIQATIRHLYLEDLSRNKGDGQVYHRGVAG